jgi:rRNA maturation endonuclease Nob1
MRVAIPFFILVGVLLGLLLSAYLTRRRPDGWRCRNAKCGAVVTRTTGKFCPTCGTPRLAADPETVNP